MIQSNESLDALATRASDSLLQTFQYAPTITAAAPGRVNLIGKHIDYCDGFVLPFAIERYVVIAAAPNGTGEIQIASSQVPGIATFSVKRLVANGGPPWTTYVRGVVHGFQKRGHRVPGFNAFVVSSVPGGAVLSSSAALECAIATLLEGLLGIALEVKEKALLCQTAERDFARVPCGIMDQFASAFGVHNHFILIDCQSEEPRLLPFENPYLTVIIANHHGQSSTFRWRLCSPA